MNDISKLLSDLLSWYWWTTVVVVGVMVNLASSYLKDPLDRAISVWSGRRAVNTAKRKQQLQLDAERLLADPVLLSLEMRGETINLLFATLLIGFAAVMLVVNQFLLGGAKSDGLIPKLVVLGLNAPPAAFVILSLRLLSRATEHGERIVAVRRLKNAA